MLSYKHQITKLKEHVVYENSKITKTFLKTPVLSYGRKQKIMYDGISMPPRSNYEKEKGCRKLKRIQ
jgi:hypothetical protein